LWRKYKMKKSLASLVVLLLISATVSAVVICDPDKDPAPFRGGQNTTLQTWTFETGANPALPDPGSVNPYGGAIIDVTGGPSSGARWLSQDVLNHQGVWVVGRGDMVATVKNNPVTNEYKDIWLQITYSAQEGNAPTILVSFPDATGAMQVQPLNEIGLPVQLDPYYYHAVYSARIRPNPAYEVISIRPRDCQVYIDCITVETQCIPEPMTMGLLGLGSLLLRRRIA
jgi:hypothetical protein